MTVNMDDDGVAPAATTPTGLERLLAGGRHIRLVVIGTPPGGLAIPSLAGCERVARVARPEAPVRAPGEIVADPLRLPFIEALFDRAIAATPLPEAAAAAELRELWRILAPAGLALLVIPARRRWQLLADGWPRDTLETVVTDALFEVLDWRIEACPDRHHLVLVGKVDGLRPALVGRVADLAPAAISASPAA